MSNPFEKLKAIVLNDSGKSGPSDPVYFKTEKAAEFLSTSKNGLNHE